MLLTGLRAMQAYANLNAGGGGAINVEYDLSAYTSTSAALTTTPVSFPSHGPITPDGSEWWVASTNGLFNRYALSTAYDISTRAASPTGSSIVAAAPIVTTHGGTRDIMLTRDGKYIIICNSAGRVDLGTLATAWDPSSVSWQTNAMTSHAPQGCTISDDGSYIYTIDFSTKVVRQWTLSTAWDLSTASLTNTTSLAASVPNSTRGISIDTAGDTVWVYDNSLIVYEFALSTPFDISTFSLTTSQSFSGLVSFYTRRLSYNAHSGNYFWYNLQSGFQVYEVTF